MPKNKANHAPLPSGPTPPPRSPLPPGPTPPPRFHPSPQVPPLPPGSTPPPRSHPFLCPWGLFTNIYKLYIYIYCIYMNLIVIIFIPFQHALKIDTYSTG